MEIVKTRAAMPGNPSFYENGLQDYSVEALQKLADKGINTLFVNLAWSRPHIDVVNLEHTAISQSFPLLSDADAVARNREKLNQRVQNAKQLGLKTMALFGIPQYFDYAKLPDSYKVLMGASQSTIAAASVTCTESTGTLLLYRELIEDFLRHVPDIDGMLVYTYDELAEICDEDSDCPCCHGIPQEERIARFLNTIYDCLQSCKKGLELWWEPWELSWSQVYGTLERLNTHVTVSCHSTLHEVYFANHPDLWFRSVAALCKEQGRDMVGELFMGGTGEDLGFTPMYPCPRLVFEQISFVSRIPGVTGVKEYYGICPRYMSVNEEVMGMCFSGAENYDLILDEIAGTYCGNEEEKDKIKQFWSITSNVLELIPWELSWVMRQYNYHPYDTAYWGQVSFSELMKTPWSTPSWLSNRRSYYMVSDNAENLNKTYCRDIHKRFLTCIELFNRASLLGSRIEVKEEKKAELRLQLESVAVLRMFIQCRLNHLLLSASMKELAVSDEALNTIMELLTSEKENAEAMVRLLSTSEVPYMINCDTIQKGIAKIEEFMEEARTSKECVLHNHAALSL